MFFFYQFNLIHPSIKTLFQKCDRSDSQAALGYLKIPDMSITYDCGGTLISAFYILTADHCVRSRYPTVVRLGKVSGKIFKFGF